MISVRLTIKCRVALTFMSVHLAGIYNTISTEKSPPSLCLLSSKIFDFMATQFSLIGLNLDVFDPYSNVSSNIVVVSPQH